MPGEIPTILMREMLCYNYTNIGVEKIPKEVSERWMKLISENTEKNNIEIKKIEQTYVKQGHYAEILNVLKQFVNVVKPTVGN